MEVVVLDKSSTESLATSSASSFNLVQVTMFYLLILDYGFEEI